MPGDTSRWLATESLSTYPKLTQNIRTDVAIVGGGLAGILSAYLLAKAGKRVVILEKGRLAQAATGYTTAFLCQLIDTDYSDLEQMIGRAQAKLVWQSHGKGIDLIEKIVKDERIGCDFMRCDNYVYANTRREWRELMHERDTMKKLGAKIADSAGLPFENEGVFAIENQGKFHPLKFIDGILRALKDMGVEIYENTEVTKIGKGAVQTVTTKNGKEVKAGWTIRATYQPFDNPHEVFLKKGLYRSYLVEFKVPKGRYEEATYEDGDNPYHYMRVDSNGDHDLLLVGGEDHRAELKLDAKKVFGELEKYTEETFGEKFPVTRRWSGLILEPLDGLAYIGEVGKKQLLATAFSGNGMTYSAISAMLFRDIVMGKASSWQKLYDPSRLPNAIQLWKKSRDYVEEFVKGPALKR